MACVPTVPIRKWWPSLGALATSLAPLLPPAPGLFSTMKVWPKTFCNSGAKARARMSVVPPAANGTTMRTGLDGQACARAASGSDESKARVWRRLGMMGSPAPQSRGAAAAGRPGKPDGARAAR